MFMLWFENGVLCVEVLFEVGGGLLCFDLLCDGNVVFIFWLGEVDVVLCDLRMFVCYLLVLWFNCIGGGCFLF